VVCVVANRPPCDVASDIIMLSLQLVCGWYGDNTNLRLNSLTRHTQVRPQITNIVQRKTMKNLIFIPVLSMVLSCNGSSGNGSTAIVQSVKINSVKSSKTLVKADYHTVPIQEKPIVKNDNNVKKNLSVPGL
jgi:hypothetical protein